MSDEMRRASALLRVMEIKEYQIDLGIREHEILDKLATSLATIEALDIDKVSLVVDTLSIAIFGLDGSCLEEYCTGLVNRLSR